MKFIGFIQEHDNIVEAIGLDDAKKSKSLVETERIIHYLSQGVLLFSWMGYVKDLETGDLIAPDSYFTDGIWVWPSYFPYYLKKYPTMAIDEEFIEYLSTKDYEFNLSANFGELRGGMERNLLQKFNAKHDW